MDVEQGTDHEHLSLGPPITHISDLTTHAQTTLANRPDRGNTLPPHALVPTARFRSSPDRRRTVLDR